LNRSITASRRHSHHQFAAPDIRRRVQLYQSVGQTIADLDPTDDLGVIVAQQNGLGLYAVADPAFSGNSGSYEYRTMVVDPDGDSITFALTVFPIGMWIDPATGVIRWAPGADAIGNHNVTVLASDGRGGIATQAYVVAVLPDPANHPPSSSASQ